MHIDDILCKVRILRKSRKTGQRRELLSNLPQRCSQNMLCCWLRSIHCLYLKILGLRHWQYFFSVKRIHPLILQSLAQKNDPVSQFLTTNLDSCLVQSRRPDWRYFAFLGTHQWWSRLKIKIYSWWRCRYGRSNTFPFVSIIIIFLLQCDVIGFWLMK